MLLFTEDPPVGGTDVDIQLLEAAKAGDMEVVKVCSVQPSCLLLRFFFTPIRKSITSELRIFVLHRDYK